MAEEVDVTEEQIVPNRRLSPRSRRLSSPTVFCSSMWPPCARSSCAVAPGPRLGEHHDPDREAPIKPERIAMEEVRRGVVQYEVPEFKPRPADPKL